MLSIVEIEYDVSPGGEREYEIYSNDEEDLMQPPVWSTTSLHEAVDYCYSLGLNFNIKTLAAWHREQGSEVDNYGQLVLPW